MKRRYWIGGVLLVMMLWGMMGCGRTEAPPAGQMVDGPGMINTDAPLMNVYGTTGQRSTDGGRQTLTRMC